MKKVCLDRDCQDTDIILMSYCPALALVYKTLSLIRTDFFCTSISPARLNQLKMSSDVSHQSELTEIHHICP